MIEYLGTADSDIFGSVTKTDKIIIKNTNCINKIDYKYILSLEGYEEIQRRLHR